MRDKIESKSVAAHVELSAIYGKKIKADIIGPMASHVASFLVSGEKIILLDVQNKVIYRGLTKSPEIKKRLLIPIEISQLYNLLFDRPVSGWKCQFDSNQYVKLCVNKKDKSRIQWKDRKGLKKIVLVENSQAKVQLAFEYFTETIEDPKNKFTIPQPSSFDRKQL